MPLKCTCIPFLLHSFLNFSPVLGMYGTPMWPCFCCYLLAVVVGGVGGLLVGMGELVLPLVEGPRRKLAVL